jgi:hypothetical protein
MKFFAVTLGLFAADVLSAAVAVDAGTAIARDIPIVRQINVITGVLDAVGTDIDELDAAVLAFTGNSANVEARAADLINTLTTGKTTVDASASLSLADALGLQGPVQELTDQAEKLKNDFIAKRPVIISNKLCGRSRTILGNINTNANALINSVILKVPSAARPIAESLAKDLRDILAEVVAAFSTANCPA